MEEAEVIARLVKENLEFKESLEQIKKSASSIHSMIYCIGGPLNDNVYGYSKEQMKIFWEIAGETECILNHFPREED
jgi:hypothetical protein